MTASLGVRDLHVEEDSMAIAAWASSARSVEACLLDEED